GSKDSQIMSTWLPPTKVKLTSSAAQIPPSLWMHSVAAQVMTVTGCSLLRSTERRLIEAARVLSPPLQILHLKERVDQRFRAWGAAGDVDVDRHDRVDPVEDRRALMVGPAAAAA